MNHVLISVTNIYGTLNVSGPSDVSIQLLIQQRVFIKWRNAWEASDAMSRSGSGSPPLHEPCLHVLTITQLLIMYRCVIVSIILYSVLSRTTLSSYVDPHYLACEPQTCGNQSITYPFYIQGKQQPFCGYPGFAISCDSNGFLILSLSNTPYIIHQIFYHNQSLRVSNAAFSSANSTNTPDSCISAAHNLTLPPTSTFNLVHQNNHKDIMFFFGCNLSSMPLELLDYRIGCSEATNKTDGSVLALYKDDVKTVSLVSKSCGTGGEVVDAVVEESEGVGMEEELRRGFMLNWTASDCKLCNSTGGRCGFNSTIFTFQCYCTDRIHASKCVIITDGRSKASMKMGLALGLAAAVTLLLVMVTLYYTRRKKQNPKHLLVDAFLERHGYLQIKRYSYSDMKKMTNSFKNKLGAGGFGSVYKGQLKDGRHVAVKILSELKGDGEDFINEVVSMSRTSHVNIVALLGFCFEGSKQALVYDFMPNGSLEKLLSDEHDVIGDRQLDYQTLYDIAIGVAKGLEYLHKGCNTRILHFDIKPHNILLDENFCPKISDFGLAKVCTRKESMVSISGTRGTAGYIAPEVFSRNFGVISHKSDVYSYGMMVLEMVGRRRNIKTEVDASSETYFPYWIYNRLVSNQELGLRSISNEFDNEKVRKLIIVSLWCIQTNPSNRPSISKVVEMLEGRIELLQLPPKPFWFSPSASP
ncbi:LEAF RUST 10 DISEASE-RESISTANCE LOCUS RECEPTOR-LIKE PROTEIN KINASE-like 2.1 isoform X2 [Arachis duranensis]|uniref:non-specific serine/threonine protein kinase n=1 Tax=Arachis duranensis TaxID=130453 RepID=A0A6P4BRV0_ARADU|nr:LEAF RUST 10 DISEASE-RESISTANCE LOCUS RECEPTOR-LIKE PROTEIN KINASE-like 2.1 isoform X2 [Arachis duranensis]